MAKRVIPEFKRAVPNREIYRRKSGKRGPRPGSKSDIREIEGSGGPESAKRGKKVVSRGSKVGRYKHPKRVARPMIGTPLRPPDGVESQELARNREKTAPGGEKSGSGGPEVRNWQIFGETGRYSVKRGVWREVGGDRGLGGQTGSKIGSFQAKSCQDRVIPSQIVPGKRVQES